MPDTVLSGNITGSDIRVTGRLGKSIDDVITPEDHIIFLCMTCETYLLPREIHNLVRRGRDNYGRPISEVIFQCPVCHPFADRNDDNPPVSDFYRLSREMYEFKRKYDRAGLIIPDSVQLTH